MTDEYLDVVNDDDAVVGRETRSTIHRRGLRHRGVHVFLFTEDGMLLVQQRGSQKEASPSALDCSVSEHLQAGEGYQQAARRGLREELGLEGVALSPVVCFSMTYGENDHKISQLYEGIVKPESVRFDPDEVAAIAYHRLADLLAKLKVGDGEFSRWFRELLLWYCGEPSDLQVRQRLEKGHWLP
jgi:isopentenyldiphosphate isomerase